MIGKRLILRVEFHANRTMAVLSDLTAAGLIEKDSHGDVLWTWSYPTVSSQQRDMLMSKCCLSQSDDIIPLVYSRWQQEWFYIYTTIAESEALKNVSHFSLVLLTKDFNPEKYEALCKVLAKLYSRTGNPASMLQSYLSVVTKGMCNGEENGAFVISNFDNQQAYVASSIKDIINMFQIETILIYTALLLKRKVIVYHPNVQELLKCIRALPTLIWHRKNWNILYPYTHLDSNEINALQKNTGYVAGFTNAAVETRTDLFDLFVNLSVGEITVSPNSKETFSMGKLHKDLALHMVNAASDDEKSNQEVIKDISVKTKELLNNLKTLATEDDGRLVIKLETLKQRKMPASTENFLFNLAAAEGLVQM